MIVGSRVDVGRLTGRTRFGLKPYSQTGHSERCSFERFVHEHVWPRAEAVTGCSARCVASNDTRTRGDGGRVGLDGRNSGCRFTRATAARLRSRRDGRADAFAGIYGVHRWSCTGASYTRFGGGGGGDGGDCGTVRRVQWWPQKVESKVIVWPAPVERPAFIPPSDAYAPEETLLTRAFARAHSAHLVELLLTHLRVYVCVMVSHDNTYSDLCRMYDRFFSHTHTRIF